MYNVPTAEQMLPISQRFQDALTYAVELHADHARKGSGIPYIAHLLSVAALAMEHGADEDQAIAALSAALQYPGPGWAGSRSSPARIAPGDFRRLGEAGGEPFLHLFFDTRNGELVRWSCGGPRWNRRLGPLGSARAGQQSTQG